MLDLGVFLLDEEFAIGADLRFSRDAEVLILSGIDFNRERIHQMLARG